MRWPLQFGRKKMIFFLLFIIIAASITGGLIGFDISGGRERASDMHEEMSHLKLRLQFYESLYRSRQEDVFTYENGNNSMEGQAGGMSILSPSSLNNDLAPWADPTLAPDIISMLKNMSGTHTANGFDAKNLTPLKMHMVSYQLLPHLLKNRNSIRPLFHMGGGRTFADIVVGVTSVKRDKESYLIITLTQLVEGLSDAEEPRTLIVVYLGETDPAFIIRTAMQIERLFSKQLESGLLEVIAPSAAFYPDLDQMQPTLGDSMKRFKWRTKQNLDNVFLMTYCRPRATFYLMLEDDVITKKNYVTEIEKFIATTTIASPNWVVLEFCRVGGIGKLFKNADLVSFITYIQLFYTNMPIDWLIETYLTHKICNIEKNDKLCAKAKIEIRPRYDQSLFQHIGLYSSLPGKIQKLKDNHFGTITLFTAHQNPPLAKLNTTIRVYSDHTLAKAYNGQSHFWGLTPKKGDIVEFKFKSPIGIERYKFKSGSVERVSDIFYGTTVEVLPASVQGSNFIKIGQFNELGVAEGVVDSALGKICSLRLHVQQNSEYWVILSEILIKEHQI